MITAFVKKHAGFFSAALAAVLLGLPLWFAVFGKHADAVVDLLKALTAPALVGGGVVVWFVTQFKEEIGSLLRRIKKLPGGIELSEEEVEKSGLAGSIPPGSSLGEIWEKAQAGSVREQFQLGLAFHFGRGVKADMEEAARWFRCAAEQGHVEAQFNLGWAYHLAQGVAHDDAEAAKWWCRAAEQGLAKAQNNLGMAYRKGVGVPQDDAEAVKWYRRAAEQGHAKAQCSLGTAYGKGKGVPQDDAEAVKWWRLAAGQGNAKAQYNLGMAYRDGKGVPQDGAEAVKWWRLAAGRQGDTIAKDALERLREAGAAD